MKALIAATCGIVILASAVYLKGEYRGYEVREAVAEQQRAALPDICRRAWANKDSSDEAAKQSRICRAAGIY